MTSHTVKSHVFHARVYYADTDAGGVLYHGTYLAFAERARLELLRDAGLAHESMRLDHDRIFMVRRANLEYLRPARLDDMLTITTTKLAETGATITLRQVFSRGSETLAVVEVLLACTSPAGRPGRIPAPWRQIHP